jgi:hypothetical protein
MTCTPVREREPAKKMLWVYGMPLGDRAGIEQTTAKQRTAWNKPQRTQSTQRGARTTTTKKKALGSTGGGSASEP